MKYTVTSFICGLLSTVFTASGAQWITNTPLPTKYTEHTMAYFGGYLYQAGGLSYTNGTDDGTNVFYARVSSNGLTETWTATTGLPESVHYHAGLAYGGFLYVLGGVHSLATGDYCSDVIYYSKLEFDGSVGAWQTSSPLPYTLTGFGVAAWNNRIYITGGFTERGPTNAVFWAQMHTNGSLGPTSLAACTAVARYRRTKFIIPRSTQMEL